MVADGQGGNERVEGVVVCRVEEPLMPTPLLASCGKLCSGFYKRRFGDSEQTDVLIKPLPEYVTF